MGRTEGVEDTQQRLACQIIAVLAVGLHQADQGIQRQLVVAIRQITHGALVAGFAVVPLDHRLHLFGRRCLGDEVDARTYATRLGAVTVFRLEGVQQLTGLFTIAFCDQHRGEVDAVFRCLGGFLRQLLIQRLGGDEVAAFQCSGRLLREAGTCSCRRLDLVLLEELANLGFRTCAGEVACQTALDDQLDVRHRAHAQLSGDVLLFLGVQLGQDEAARIFTCQLLEDRRQDEAVLALRRPAIQQYRHLL